MNGWAAATNPQKMRVEPLLLMKMKYDGVFYDPILVSVDRFIFFFKCYGKKSIKINAMWLTRNLLLDWVHTWIHSLKKNIFMNRNVLNNFKERR